MGMKEHLERLQRVRRELEATKEQDALVSSLDAIAVMKLRLAEGESPDGGPFTDYSLPYAKVRQQKGLRTDRKDFNVTGRLYASIQPEVRSASADGVTVAIAPKGQDNRDKVRGAASRGDRVVGLSEQEVKEVLAMHTERRRKRASNVR